MNWVFLIVGEIFRVRKKKKEGEAKGMEDLVCLIG